jgi:excisionase family DNA binding protein
MIKSINLISSLPICIDILHRIDYCVNYMQKTVGITEMARMAKVTRQTIYNLIRAKKLPYVSVEKTELKIPMEAAIKYLKSVDRSKK